MPMSLSAKGIENKHLAVFGLLFILALGLVRYTQSIDEYNEFCEENPASMYCVCGMTPTTGDYTQADLDGKTQKFHEDVWVQRHVEPDRIVTCMRGRIQTIAECPYGVTGSSPVTYACLTAPSEPTPTDPEEAGGAGISMLILGGFLVLALVGLYTAYRLV